MATVRIPPVLRPQLAASARSTAGGSSVGEVLACTDRRAPRYREPALRPDGDLNRYVNVYLNDEDVRVLDGLDTAVGDGGRGRHPAGDGRRLRLRVRPLAKPGYTF